MLKEGQGFATPAHDVIEDWAIIRWIELFVTKHEWQALPISQNVSWHPAIRRGFREWLKENLDGDVEKADQFVLFAIRRRFASTALSRRRTGFNTALPLCGGFYFAPKRTKCWPMMPRLLTRLIHLVRVACKKVAKQPRIPNMPLSTLLVPEGGAWQALLEVVADELDHLLPKHIGSILGPA